MHRFTPYFILFALMLLFLSGSVSAASSTSPVYLPLIIGPTTTETPESSPMNELLVLVNAERVANSCPSMTLNTQLSQAAQRHSDDMAMNNFFSHVSSDGSTITDRVNATGYTYSLIAENIAAGQATPREVFSAWMSSPGHRANIMNCSLTDMGLGFYYQSDDQPDVRTSTASASGPYYYYWTQTFGQPR